MSEPLPLWSDDRILTNMEDEGAYADSYIGEKAFRVFKRMRDEYEANRRQPVPNAASAGVWMPYSHRNGEEQVPDESGYYWFKGVRRIPDDDGNMTDELMESLGMVRVDTEHAPMILMSTVSQTDMFVWHSHGQWWGPLTPPWESRLVGDAPQVPLPDWSQAPEWAMWWATDESGHSFWYEEKPVAHEEWEQWESVARITNCTKEKCESWRTTLQQRPQ